MKDIAILRLYHHLKRGDKGSYIEVGITFDKHRDAF
jgi:hypothetical protein